MRLIIKQSIGLIIMLLMLIGLISLMPEKPLGPHTQISMDE